MGAAQRMCANKEPVTALLKPPRALLLATGEQAAGRAQRLRMAIDPGTPGICSVWKIQFAQNRS